MTGASLTMLAPAYSCARRWVDPELALVHDELRRRHTEDFRAIVIVLDVLDAEPTGMLDDAGAVCYCYVPKRRRALGNHGDIVANPA